MSMSDIDMENRHCKKLAPVYDAAAAELGERGVLAKIDCSTHTDICKQNGVEGYPTLKYFSNGKAVEYSKGRSQKDLVNFMLEQARPPVTRANTQAELDDFVKDASDIVLIGFFDAEVVPAVFEKVAERLRVDDFSFASSSNVEIAGKFGVTFPGIVAFKKFGEPHAIYSGSLENEEEIVSFAITESFPLVGLIGPDSYRKYVDRRLPIAYLFVDPKNPEQRDDVISFARKVAGEYKGKLSIVEIDGIQFSRHGDSLGLTAGIPAIVIHDMEGQKKFILQGVTLTEGSVADFFKSYAAGTLTPFFKSQPAPESNDGPVKVIVRSTFDEIVNDPTRDVLAEFYAPWCGHCKELKPKFELLGQEYANDKGIFIAMGDATENDFVIPGIEIEGFPTLIFFPANNKAVPVKYEGERTFEAMKAFVEESRTTEKAVKEL